MKVSPENPWDLNPRLATPREKAWSCEGREGGHVVAREDVAKYGSERRMSIPKQSPTNWAEMILDEIDFRRLAMT
jgi:hypothetical protein